MAGENRVGGTIKVRTGGRLMDAAGAFTYGFGGVTRTAKLGADARVHGYTETTRVAFIEGTLTDSRTLDVAALELAENQTVTLELPNGKTFTLSGAWFAGEGGGETGEGNLTVRWESKSKGKEV